MVRPLLRGGGRRPVDFRIDMAGRSGVYFVADVHLGLGTHDPAEREERFVRFLKGIPRDTAQALYLLGDIWDFWYEYRDVIPREGTRVVAQLIDLMDNGVQVFFCSGNHDIWTYSYFESIGMKKFAQPYYAEIGGKTFCLGHGDLLGGARTGYKLMLGIFRCRFLQRCFSLLHPWLAFRFGLGWSNSNRRSHKPYHFRGEEEPLYRFAVEQEKVRHADYYVFGHFHDRVSMTLPSGSQFIVLKDWMEGGEPYGCFNGSSFELR